MPIGNVTELGSWLRYQNLSTWAIQAVEGSLSAAIWERGLSICFCLCIRVVRALSLLTGTLVLCPRDRR